MRLAMCSSVRLRWWFRGADFQRKKASMTASQAPRFLSDKCVDYASALLAVSFSNGLTPTSVPACPKLRIRIVFRTCCCARPVRSRMVLRSLTAEHIQDNLNDFVIAHVLASYFIVHLTNFIL